MLVAFWDQLLGNSTPRCSKAGLSGIADHRVADLPLDLVERMHAGSRKPPLYREALRPFLGVASGGLGHRTSPLAATFRGNSAGSLTDRTEKVPEVANKALRSRPDVPSPHGGNSAISAQMRARTLRSMVEDLRRGAERMGERASAARDDGRAGHRRQEAVGERATAAKEATADAIAAGQAEAARRLARVGLLPLARLRRRPDRPREDAEGDPGGGDLRGQPLGPVRHQRPLPPGQLDPAPGAPVDAAPGSLDDLLPHRRHLHALRAAGPRRRRSPTRSSSSSGSARSPARSSR